MFNPLKVYGRREILELLGLSQKTWERLESRNDIPVKTRLSDNRVGFRGDHLKEWLDGRVQGSTKSAA